MKIKIWKSKRDGRWVIADPSEEEVRFSRARTWDLAMAQARWLMQHMRAV